MVADEVADRELLVDAMAEVNASIAVLREKATSGDFDPLKTASGRTILALEALIRHVVLQQDRIDRLEAAVARVAGGAGGD